MLSLRSRLAQWWATRPAWFRWTVGLVPLIAIAVARALRSRPEPHTSASDLEHIANAVRPRMLKEAAEREAEAERLRQFAERRAEEAKAEQRRILTAPPEELLRAGREYEAKKRGLLPKLVLLAALSVPAGARAAEPVTEVMAHPESAAEGYWVPADTYRHLLADALALEGVEASRSKLLEALEAERQAAAKWREIANAERALLDVATRHLGELQRVAQPPPWWRSARLWAPVTAVLGVAAGAWVGVRAAQ